MEPGARAADNRAAMVDATRWTMISRAAGGDDDAWREFVECYAGPVRAYLGARWRDTPWHGEVEDTLQEVFLQCARAGGVLERADPARGGFRAFLYGITRREAQKVETRRARERAHLTDASVDGERVAADETTLSRVFDRQWARDLMEEAYARFRALADDPAHARRVELLRLRFEEGLPVREVADRWGEDAAHLHRELSRAKDEFRRGLRDAIQTREGYAGSNLERECEVVLGMLQAD